MIKQILLYPMIGMLFLTLALSLTEVAEKASEDVLVFAYDMQQAVDCATQALPLEECSPNLYNHSFKEQIEENIQLNMEITSQLKKIIDEHEEQYNITETEDAFIIIIDK